ncbi:aldehyde dehydrogenase family protein (plasmid) [Rhodococcus sp. USK10]|uniref:aldehyde dehydrogenase family protein n=1 Tax=Rhodococcus sp. USK10 TaxID=2789739 RepID=UPI001C5F7E36|nr:aldehyde dehydrogenase family protein [Rhodococcus sp. USK10]QYB00167.1 aldehyde dehydrogenase family protein [Rhodococcus sp. USK10]
MTDFSLLINGATVAGESTMPVINPATGEVFADAPRASTEQLNEAVKAANDAFPEWSQTALDDRRQVLRGIADIVSEHADELVELIIAEAGKPVREARREVGGTAAFFRYVSGMATPGHSIEDPTDRDIEITYRPLGPVAAIIPWNFPLMTIAFKLPWILLAGNTVVIKPAPTTPLATLRFAELVSTLLPPGVLNVITDDNDLGPALTAHPGIRKVSFTGSTVAGQSVMRNAVDTLKRLTLELGGNDAAIVLDDADPKTVAAGVYASAFQNNGQVCLAVKRLYVQVGIYDEVCAELAALADAAVVGDGADEQSTHGPVQNAKQFTKLVDLLAVAHRDGTVIAGGKIVEGRGYFLRPTIVRDIVEGSELVDDEQFGPILPVIKFDTADEVLQRSNNTAFGLGGSVWSSDADRAQEVARRVDAGTVWINKHADIAPHIPFGGAKMSGVGSEFAQEGFVEFSQRTVINRTRA